MPVLLRRLPPPLLLLLLQNQRRRPHLSRHPHRHPLLHRHRHQSLHLHQRPNLLLRPHPVARRCCRLLCVDSSPRTILMPMPLSVPAPVAASHVTMCWH